MSNKKARNKEILKQLSAESEGLNKLHVELFPEEYDYIYDDSIDKARRKQGINLSHPLISARRGAASRV